MNTEDQISLLNDMMRIRRMEELCAELYTQEKIRGFLHLYIGEEAVATGVLAHARKQDNVMATYREHAHALLKGISAKYIMAELFGKVTGCSNGRGGSMHLFSRELRFFGGTAIVSGGVSQGIGIAYAAKRLNEDRRTFCFFGEGAMAEGSFYESMNLASLWQVPLLLCCENNFYAMGTALSRSQSQTDLLTKVRAFKIEAASADGMDVTDVYEKTEKALEYIKTEKKPFFLECKTYRFKSHSMYDPDLYREKSEIEKWKLHDPIATFAEKLTQKNIINKNEIKIIQNEIETEMQEAVSFADQSSFESEETIRENLFATARIQQKKEQNYEADLP